MLQTAGVIALAVAFGVWAWPSPWLLLAVLVIGVEQHALFILAHEAAHYRLFRDRRVNDAVGRLIGMAGAISMCTYRVIHRLHHNNLYTDDDPDTAIHGGYPRGTAYLWKKLGQDADRLERLEDVRLLLRRAGAERRHATRRPAARRHLAAAAPHGAASTAGSSSPSSARCRWRAWRSAAGAAWRSTRRSGCVPMLTVLQPILRLRAICEHGAVSDFASPLTAARSNRTGGGIANVLGRVLLFPHHVNYHLEHHLYPAVPHYHLPRLHRLLAEKGALDGAEVRDLAATLDLVFAPRQRRRQPELA